LPKIVDILSPLPGVVVKVNVQPNQRVKEGDPVITLSSMKMEFPVESECSGLMEVILVKEGDEIAQGKPLARIRTED